VSLVVQTFALHRTRYIVFTRVDTRFFLSQFNSRYTSNCIFNASQVISYHLRLGRVVDFLSSHFPTKIFKTLCMLITYSFDLP